jgi:DNA-binding transcriptional LysR family regulator
VPGLLRGDIDIAVIDEWFAAEPTLPDGLHAEHLLDDLADLAIPADHPLAQTVDVIDLHSCADENWITWRAGEFGHDWLLRALGPHRPNLRFAHTAGEHQTILALVDAGLGIALMPRLGRGPVPDGVIIKPLNPTMSRRAFALCRTETKQRPAVRVAIEALKQLCR